MNSIKLFDIFRYFIAFIIIIGLIVWIIKLLNRNDNFSNKKKFHHKPENKLTKKERSRIKNLENNLNNYLWTESLCSTAFVPCNASCYSYYPFCLAQKSVDKCNAEFDNCTANCSTDFINCVNSYLDTVAVDPNFTHEKCKALVKKHPEFVKNIESNGCIAASAILYDFSVSFMGPLAESFANVFWYSCSKLADYTFPDDKICDIIAPKK